MPSVWYQPPATPCKDAECPGGYVCDKPRGHSGEHMAVDQKSGDGFMAWTREVKITGRGAKRREVTTTTARSGPLVHLRLSGGRSAACGARGSRTVRISLTTVLERVWCGRCRQIAARRAR